MNWYLKAFKQYADFKGRARRKEYWFFGLFNMIFAFMALTLDNLFGITLYDIGYGPLYILYALIVFIPGLAITVRRLHDVGKSGWMIFISLIPVVGTIWLLVLLVTDSEPKTNEYGENPKMLQEGEIISTNTNVRADSTDTILLGVVIWLVVSALFWKFIMRFNMDFYSSNAYHLISSFSSIIWGCIPIVLAFVVKDKSKKIVMFVLGGIYILIELYGIVERFLA
ncbi:DUF805 domain-containing protein [Aquimarina sp. W85]|uniref:DUF805 domain-containing protein n=1 Tax=Aquimarina rhodophyticola TaxID=3342246 RepID=UPI00366BC757